MNCPSVEGRSVMRVRTGPLQGASGASADAESARTHTDRSLIVGLEGSHTHAAGTLEVDDESAHTHRVGTYANPDHASTSDPDSGVAGPAMGRRDHQAMKGNSCAGRAHVHALT